MKFVKVIILIFSAIISAFSVLNLFGVYPFISNKIDNLSEKERYTLNIFLFLLATFYFACIIIRETKDKNDHTFCVKSIRYYRYFTKWYNKTGKIKIFCGNLEWIQNQSLINALIKKSQNSELKIFLEKTDRNSNILHEHGAQVYIVNNNVINIQKMSFSIRDVDSSKSCIIRYNTEDNHKGREIKITVHEIYNEPQKELIYELSNLIVETSTLIELIDGR